MDSIFKGFCFLLIVIGSTPFIWADDYYWTLHQPLYQLTELQKPRSQSCSSGFRQTGTCPQRIYYWAESDRQDALLGLLKSNFNTCTMEMAKNVETKSIHIRSNLLSRHLERRVRPSVISNIQNCIEKNEPNNTKDHLNKIHFLAKSEFALNQFEKSQLEYTQQIAFYDQYLGESNHSEKCENNAFSRVEDLCKYLNKNCSRGKKQKQDDLIKLTQDCEDLARNNFAVLKKNPESVGPKKSLMIIHEMCPWIFQERYLALRSLDSEFHRNSRGFTPIGPALHNLFQENRSILESKLSELKLASNCFQFARSSDESCEASHLNLLLYQTPAIDENNAHAEMAAESCVSRFSYDRDNTAKIIKDESAATVLALATLGAGYWLSAARTLVATRTTRVISQAVGATIGASDLSVLVSAGVEANKACSEEINKLDSKTYSKYQCPAYEDQKRLQWVEKNQCQFAIALALAQGLPIGSAVSTVLGKFKRSRSALPKGESGMESAHVPKLSQKEDSLEDIFREAHSHSETGISKSTQVPFDTPADSKTYFVGKGGAAMVYRNIEANGQSHIIKHYSSMDLKEDDLERFQTLLKLYDQQGDNLNLSLVKILGHRGQFIHMQDIRGIPLDQILNRADLSSSLKQRLINQYQKGVSEWVQKLKSQYQLMSEDQVNIKSTGTFDYIISFMDPKTFRITKFNFKAENVITQADGRLVLIDPY